MELGIIIEAVISLTLIFALFSLIVTWANEWFVGRKAIRAKFLEKHIQLLLGNSLAKQLIEHPLIQSLITRRSKNALPKKGLITEIKKFLGLSLTYYHAPSYIPAAQFVQALTDIITDGKPTTAAEQFVGFKNGVEKLSDESNKSLKTILHVFVTQTVGDFEKLQASLGKWYDDYMDRVTGTYKRKQRPRLFMLGLLTAVIFHLDVFELVNYLTTNKEGREGVVKVAEAIAESPPVSDVDLQNPPPDLDKVRQVVDTVVLISEGLKLPIFWKADTARDEMVRKKTKRNQTFICKPCTLDSINFTKYNCDTSGKPALKNPADKFTLVRQARDSIVIDTVHLDNKHFPKSLLITNRFKDPWSSSQIVLSWLCMAAALSFGAPFWFDLLLRFVNIRSSGVKPPKDNVNPTK